jgi:hypothetical protein
VKARVVLKLRLASMASRMAMAAGTVSTLNRLQVKGRQGDGIHVGEA